MTGRSLMVVLKAGKECIELILTFSSTLVESDGWSRYRTSVAVLTKQLLVTQTCLSC